jgi:hypothetical protein
MNSSELKSMPTSYVAPQWHSDREGDVPKAPTRRQVARYWSAFAATTTLIVLLTVWFIHAPGQDHIGSIPLNGDGSWYHNYELGHEISDPEILFDGIGHSIGNAQAADIVLLGTSKLIFGIDWRLFESFERKHHLKIFNMALAGISSGDFSLRVVRKWNLHPKLWVVHTDLYNGDLHTSFFFMDMSSAQGFGTSAAARVVNYTRARAFVHVVGRNIRWRLRMAMGLLNEAPYRSANTGNWYVDNWPNSASDKNPLIQSRVGRFCPASPEEAEGAKRYFEALGGPAILIQVPSAFSCAQRVHELASVVALPSFTTEPEQFSTSDGGGHLDRVSARRYTAMFFEWLEQVPEFQKLFPD